MILKILTIVHISFAQKWTYYNTSNSDIPSNNITSFSIKNDTIIVGTQNGGMAIFDQTNWTTFNTDNSIIPSNNVKKVIYNNKGIWLSCFIGIGYNYLVRIKNDDWRIWTNILNNQESNFSDIEFDESGIAWMVTGYASGWVTRFNEDTFESFNSNNSCLPKFSSSGKLPFSIKVIDEETRWIGLLDNTFGSAADNTGVVLMENDICTYYNPDNSNFPENHQAIKEIHNDSENDNIIWFLSNDGIIKFDGQFWEDIYIPSAPNTMTFDNDNRLWVDIRGIGLRYYKNGEWFMPIENPGGSVQEMHVDEKNRLWVSTETNGLAYFNLDELQNTSTKFVDNKKVIVFPTIFKDYVTVNLEDINLKGVEFNLFDMEGHLLLKESIVLKSTSFNIPETLKSFFIYTIVKDNVTIGSGKLFRVLAN